MNSRRDFLARLPLGFGALALRHVLAQEGRSPAPHAAARARNVIFLFMEGGPSQVDLFDPKPALARLDGQPLPESMREGLRFAFIKPNARVWASRREFRRHGQSGIFVSDWLPHTARCVDRLCVIRSMFSEQFNHHPGQLMLHCGSPMVGRPSMGSWLAYGLGSESRDLPGFVVLTSGRGGSASSGIFSNGFLPSRHSGVPFAPGGEPVAYLSSPKGIDAAEQRARLDAMRDLNERHRTVTGDDEIGSRIASYELAFRMQTAAPELLDLSSEPPAIRARYGVDREPMHAFARNCLLARRMVERGVRFVLVSHASWDDHGSLVSGHTKNCEITDQPCATLIEDLHQRGLLDETIVVWAGEFGRTPLAQSLNPERESATGRDHHPDAFTVWAAGGGFKGGLAYGRTDDLCMKVAENRVHVHDLHGTMLHCLGLDHEKLTYRHQGRDYRLTDLAGSVVQGLLA